MEFHDPLSTPCWDLGWHELVQALFHEVIAAVSCLCTMALQHLTNRVWLQMATISSSYELSSFSSSEPRVEVCDTDIVFVYATLSYSLLFDKLWVISVSITNYCKKKLL